MFVDGEHDEQHAQELGDRQVWGRVRITTDTERAERANMARPVAGPKWRSSHREQCLFECVSEIRHEVINASSVSHSTNQQRLRELEVVWKKRSDMEDDDRVLMATSAIGRNFAGNEGFFSMSGVLPLLSHRLVATADIYRCATDVHSAQ
jgi:hypothetical protein